MQWEELYSKNEIETHIRFDKNMDTVYELSYFLVDFQAVINNLTEMVYDDISVKVIPNPKTYLRDENTVETILVNYKDSTHPQWQQKIEEDIKEILFKPEKSAASYVPVSKQTTSRNFNKKYKTNLQLLEFSKGSLVLDVANSFLVSVLTEFLKALMFKKTGNENAINITINNSYIHIDDSVIKAIPKDSTMGKAIQINVKYNECYIDVQKCAHAIVESAQPDENIEESVKRLLVELNKMDLSVNMLFMIHEE